MQKNAFYLTTTLPYVNAKPHIGFALEIVHADIAARYHKLCGDDVFFNTGTDEHGIKIYRKALEEGKEPQAYVDEYAEKFRNLKEKLNLCPDLHFIRTTDTHHKEAAQEFCSAVQRAAISTRRITFSAGQDFRRNCSRCTKSVPISLSPISGSTR